MELWLTSIFFCILGVILTFIIGPIFGNRLSDSVNLFLAKRFGKRSVKQGMNLTGVWKQKWRIQNSGHFEYENESIVTIYQRGNKVYGEFKMSKSSYSFTGTIDKDMYLTGLWDDLNGGNNYNGAFQLYIHKYATHMTGKWLGYSEKHYINSGDWFWKRDNEDNYIYHV